VVVDNDLAGLPDDVDALKAALTVERAKMREVVAERDAGAAELAVALAKASEDLAIAAIANCAWMSLLDGFEMRPKAAQLYARLVVLA
jgi:hypothetical protein